MITSLVASLGLAVGQAPMPPMSPPGMTPVPQAPMASSVLPADCTVPAAEAPKEETKYLAEKLLAGTRVGQILECNGIKFYGWTQFSYSASSTSSSTLPGGPFGDRSGEFLLNQNWFRFEKVIDTSKSEFQWGFRNDYILPGSDARFTIARDLFDKQVRDQRVTPIDNVFSYGEMFLPNFIGGTSVKVGRFATLIGYETIDAISTPFLTRSYNFQYNPFTHTGILATSSIGDNFTVNYGIVLGTDNFIGPTNRATFHGGIKWAPKDGDTTLAFNTVITNPKYQPSEGFNHFNVYNVLLTHKLSKELTYAADFTYSLENEVPLPNNTIDDTHWYGLAQYLSYEHCDKLQSNVRVELFKDEDGYRTGTRGLYTSVSYGLTWKPKEWMSIKPEVRYDYNTNGPFEGGDRNLFIGGLSCIFRW
jgi:hypothetical protein